MNTTYTSFIGPVFSKDAQENKYPAIKWDDVEQMNNSDLEKTVNDNPRFHIDSIISQIAQIKDIQPKDPVIAKKIANAITPIKLSSVLASRFHQVLKDKELLKTDEISEIAKKQKIIRVTLETTFGLYNELKKLCDEPNSSDKQPNEHQKNCFNECKSDLLYMLKNQYIAHFPEKSAHSTALFRFLCKNVKSGDNSLYSPIRNLIARCLNILYEGKRDLDLQTDVNIFNQESNTQTTGFDELLANGGNLAEILSRVDKKIVESRGFIYLDYNEKQIGKLDSVDFILSLANPTTRGQWLPRFTDYTIFEESQIIALAQFLDSEVPAGSILNAKSAVERWNYFLDGFNSYQQSIFLKSLRPFLKQICLREFSLHRDNFKVEKQLVVDCLHRLSDYIELKSLENEQETALNNVKNMVPQSRNGDNSIKHPFTIDPNLKVDQNAFELINQISRIINALETLQIWSEKPDQQVVIQILKEAIMFLRKNCAVAKDSHLADCRKVLSSARIEGLKYEALRDVFKKIAATSDDDDSNDFDFDDEADPLDEIDWTEDVSLFFFGFDTSQFQSPPSALESEEYKDWHQNAMKLLKDHLSQFFTEDTSIKDLPDLRKAVQLSLDNNPQAPPPTKRLKSSNDNNNNN